MAKTNETDVWDQGPPGSGRAGPTFVRRTLNVKQAAKAEVVRDDWDDDDDEEEAQEGAMENTNAKAGTTAHPNDGGAPPGRAASAAEDDSSRIWEEANKRAPMPELVVASASTSQGFAPPPPAALQPALRILKRPPANAGIGVPSAPRAMSPPGLQALSSSGSGMTSPAPRGTLAEREAQYQEARSRIFGEKQQPGAVSRTSSGSGGGGVAIVRDPLGPAFESAPEPGVGGPAKGFGERRRGMERK